MLVAEFGFLDTEGPKTNSYAAIDEGFPNAAMANILGKPVTAMQTVHSASYKAMVKAFRKHHPVVFTSLESPHSDHVVHDHVYAMVGYDNNEQKILLYNPWGFGSVEYPGYLYFTYGEIERNFDYWGGGPKL